MTNYGAVHVYLLDRESDSTERMMLYPASRILLVSMDATQIEAFSVNDDGNWFREG